MYIRGVGLRKLGVQSLLVIRAWGFWAQDSGGPGAKTNSKGRRRSQDKRVKIFFGASMLRKHFCECNLFINKERICSEN